MKNLKRFGIGLLVGLSLLGCRGERSHKPPFHLNPNFDFQAKFKPQRLSLDTPDGTVAWGDRTSFSAPESRQKMLKEDTVFYYGKDAKGQFVSRAPIAATKETLLRGQERFNIYCGVCHDRVGTGKGTVPKHGFTPPPFLGDDRIVALSDGEIFDIISNGIRTMPSYGKQVPEEDRWAIVLYVRAIQEMWHSTESDVPSELRDKIE